MDGLDYYYFEEASSHRRLSLTTYPPITLDESSTSPTGEQRQQSIDDQ
jgi:hypothetical protein